MTLREEQERVQKAVGNTLAYMREDPWLAGRVLAGAKEERPVKRKISFGVICVIAVLLVGMMTALAAGVEDINALLYQLWPEAARALRPLSLSAEKAGIRLDLLSATLTDENLLITYSLTDTEGDRIREETEFCTHIGVPGMDSGSCSDELLSYDAESHRAVYASYFEYTKFTLPEGAIPGDPDTVTLSINGMVNPVTTTVDLGSLAAGRAYTAEAVPVPQGGKNVETIIRDEEAEKMEKTMPPVLDPANNMHIPVTDGVELSGIGWIDGCLHVQLHVPDHLVSIAYENGGFHMSRYDIELSLLDRQGNDVIWEEDGFFDELLRETPYFVLGMCWYDDHDEWIEKIFPVGPEAMEQYVLSAAVSERTGKAEGLLPLEWEIEFPANMIRVE